MSKILGKNVLLYIIKDESPQVTEPIGCARTAKINTTSETIPTTTKGSGTWRKNKAIINSWDISGEGLSTFDTNISIIDLRLLQTSLTEVLFYWVETDVNGVSHFYQGFANITRIEESKNYNDVLSYSFQAVGTGPLYIDVGAYPLDFEITNVEIDTPLPGSTRFTFAFSPSVPVPPTYMVRIRDLATNTVSYNAGGGSPRVVVVTSSTGFAFAIQAVYSNGSSDYSPEIYWP